MERPTLNKVKASISTYQLLMQFETDKSRVGKIQGDQQAAKECYVNSLKNKVNVQEDPKKRKREDNWPSSGLGVNISENPKKYERPQQAEEDEEVIIDKELGQTLRVGKAMDPQTREEIIQLLTKYKDVFAYEASEMQGLVCKDIFVLGE